MPQLRIVIALCLGAATFAEPSHESISVHVQPLEQECFFQDVSVGETVDAQIVVYRGGLLDVKFRIEGPTKQVLFESLIFSNKDDHTQKLLPTLLKKGHKFVCSDPGTYSLCLDNRIAKYTSKVRSAAAAGAAAAPDNYNQFRTQFRGGKALFPPPTLTQALALSVGTARSRRLSRWIS